MTPQNKQCQNCKNQFTIEPEDFDFYEKIQVPAPTSCPECRMMRKVIWGNPRSLYKRKCDVPGHSEELISKYPPEAPLPVYDNEYWWSDAWDPLQYGREYDFSRTFFDQFKELLHSVPARNLDITNSVGCDYCSSTVNCKNCYLVSAGYMAEDCLYSYLPALSRWCVDSWSNIACDTLYECFGCSKSFNIFFGIHCSDCMDSMFLYDCRNCSNCFGCVGLRSKRYHIFNKPYSRGEYGETIKKFDLGSHKQLQEVSSRFEEFLKKFPRKFAEIRNAVDCTGDIIENAKGCHYAFGIRNGAENCKYIYLGGMKLKDSYDVGTGGGKAELVYESGAVIGGQRILFSDRIQNSVNIYYSRECYSCENIFGCVGLRNKSYCILNKQYSREEYEELAPRIIKHMNTMPYIPEGRNEKEEIRKIVYKYGEFFPPEFSPFPYNESMAQELFPISPEQAASRGYWWYVRGARQHAVTLAADRLPDHIKDVSDEVVREVIACAHTEHCAHQCTGAFRIIPQELQFYRKMNLPLPRLCPNCRHYARMRFRNPWKLWHRKCQCNGQKLETSYQYHNTIEHFHGNDPCPNEFETPYAPERPEIVYCENCYNSEVV